jgi:hypothetical protein
LDNSHAREICIGLEINGTCRLSSDPRRILLKWPAGLWTDGLLLANRTARIEPVVSPSTEARVEGRNAIWGIAHFVHSARTRFVYWARTR